MAHWCLWGRGRTPDPLTVALAVGLAAVAGRMPANPLWIEGPSPTRGGDRTDARRGRAGGARGRGRTAVATAGACGGRDLERVGHTLLQGGRDPAVGGGAGLPGRVQRVAGRRTERRGRAERGRGPAGGDILWSGG